MKRIYLDNAATTPVHPEVVRVMLPYLNEVFGNPSSIHSCGLEARTTIEEARNKIAALVGARAEEIVFTSGGTEADNLAIKGIALGNETKGNHIITTSVEHHAIIEAARSLEKRGFEATYLPVDAYGMVDPDGVRKAITPKTILVSIIHANNEVGTIEPLAEISKITREAGVYFHTDAVQTVGHIPVDVDKLGVDSLSMSAHKLYGPKGVGALYIRKGTRLATMQHGGGQERNRRSGTENTASIIGFAKAIELAGQEMAAEADRLTFLRNRLIAGILERIDHTRLNGHPQIRLPNNVNVTIDYIEGEATLLNLDLEGICISTGSACSSSDQEPSFVLLAMGLSHNQAYSSLRLTLGKWTTEAEIDRVLEVLQKVVTKLRAISPLAMGRQDRQITMEM
ncbi:MAG: cysteine desulfurase NifS [Dehalococcoidales bacterium]|nr:cysteine desulfurase NifS [Dehalococcoidales bacterium]